MFHVVEHKPLPVMRKSHQAQGNHAAERPTLHSIILDYILGELIMFLNAAWDSEVIKSKNTLNVNQNVLKL